MELLVRLGHFFEQARSDADYATFANELRRHQVSYYIYFVSTGNMNFVMANDEVVSVKSARGLLRVRAEASHCLTRAAVIRHFARAINFEQYCRDLASAGVFKWIVDLEEETRHYWSKDNTLLYKECLMPPSTGLRGRRRGSAFNRGFAPKRRGSGQEYSPAGSK